MHSYERLCGISPQVRVSKAQLHRTRPSLHDMADIFASLLYKAEKSSISLSASRDNPNGFCFELGLCIAESFET